LRQVPAYTTAALDFDSLVQNGGTLQPSYAPSGSIVARSTANVTLVNDADLLDIDGSYDDSPIIGVGLRPNTLTQTAFYVGQSVQFVAPFPKRRNDVVAVSSGAVWIPNAPLSQSYALLTLQRPAFAPGGATTLQLDQFAGDDGVGFGATRFTWFGSRNVGPLVVPASQAIDDALLWSNDTVFLVARAKALTAVVRFDWTGAVTQNYAINEIVVCADR
jgi:hypothetical protein